MTRSVVKAFLCIVLAALALLSVCGCAAQSAPEQPAVEPAAEPTIEPTAEPVAEPLEPVLEDGVYSALFSSDSGMFHANEADDGRGVLTVKNGEMTLHIRMPSKNIVNLFLGLAEDTKLDSAELLEPSIESVTYDDGMTDEVFSYDIPVPVLEQEFDLALLGTKGKWYDHKVVVSDPVPVQ